MEIIKKHYGLIFVFLVSIIPLLNLLTPGLPITHDSLEHTARIASFYQSLREGNIIPRWSENLNWGFGHPILMFLYPLPEYLGSLIHFIGFSFSDSYKILMSISYIFSGIFMYVWIKNFLGEKAAIAGAIIYLYAPYRFIDLFVRGALGEHVAFVFIPLVLLAVLKLSQLPNKTNLIKYYIHFLFIALSFAGLILSHNAISLIFFPFIFIYVLYLYLENKSKKKLIINYLSLGFGFLFSFFFWLPAFIEGKYTLRDIVTNGVYADRFIQLKQLLYGSWNYGPTNVFTVQIGIIAIIISILSLVLFFKLFKKTDKQEYLLIISFVFLFVSLFLMTRESSFIWEKVTTLQKLQFPWRFLTLTVFCTSLITAFFVSKANRKFQNYLLIIIIIAAIIPTTSYWHARDYKIYSDDYYLDKYLGTTDTGESSPIWSIRFMEIKAKAKIEVINGKAKIENISRNSTKHSYKITNGEKVRIKENTLYFPGWNVYDNNNLLSNVEFQDPKNRGLITFYLDPGEHNIQLIFENTKVRKISEYVSLFSIISILIFPFTLLNKRIRKFKI